ncbi:MAG: hypothetical protein FJ276_31930 [Planctomycetes bacterium]|nr:hypothetical protein [Planctomycetota bacterium]
MLPEEKATIEFDKAHEGEFGHVIENGWRLFADGATRSVKIWDRLGAQYRLPPEDPDEVTKLQRKFWEIRLQNLVKEHDDVRQCCERSARSGTGFRQRLEELGVLQTKIRQARSKLTVLVVKERGYSTGDLDRAWGTWERFTRAIREEAECKAQYDSALLGTISIGKLEKLKVILDQAKKETREAMSRWNSFQPEQARHVVSQELDGRSRAEREAQLAEIGEV